MISRQIALMCSPASGPSLMSCKRAITCSLAFGTKHRRVEMLLDLAHFERDRGALIQQRDELRVERIDAFAQRFESGIEFVVHALI